MTAEAVPGCLQRVLCVFMEGNNPDKELLEAMPSIIPRFAMLGRSILAVPVIPTAHPKPNSTSRKLRQKYWKFKSALMMAHVLA